VQLVDDADIAAKANQRYQDAKKTATPAKFTSVNGWCNKCQSYCYGDCQAN
jgi:hypothetical protein